MQPAIDQLGDLRYILQAGSGADERADADVEAVVGEEGEGEGGGVGGGGGDEGHGQRAGEADDGDGEGDGQDGGEGGGVVEGDFGFEGEGYKVGEVEVHAGLEAGVIVAVGVVVDDGVDAAVAEDGELVAEGDFGDGDGGEEGRFLRPVEEGGQGSQDGGVGVRVATELGDGLGGEHVEPVQGLGLVGVDVVVGFGEDGGRGWRGGGTQDARGGAGTVAGGGGGGGGEGPVAAGEGARGGGGFGRGSVAEDEEFDEAGDEDYDGELAEEEALGEG